MKVFLTGGTGFIGCEVARRLRARGHEVRALVRDRARATELEKIGCILVAGELNDVPAIREGMQGSDGVIHCAGMYEVGIAKSRRPEMYAAPRTSSAPPWSRR